jgi:hypothetical protein
MKPLSSGFYELAPNPPEPMAWSSYEQIIMNAWEDLLASGTTEEQVIQRFLEQHPCLVPGAFGLLGTSGHAPYPAALFSQPILPDFSRRIPDFMWIARDSETIQPVLIEIEAPGKKWFTNRGVQRAELTQALDQIADWKIWFSNLVNLAKFSEVYQIQGQGCSVLGMSGL